MQVALGRVRIGVDEFWDMTPREFHLAVQGYYEERQEQYRHDYEVARFEAYLGKVEFQGKTKGKVTVQDLYRFSWEKGLPNGVHRLKPGIRNPEILNMMTKRFK